MHGFLDFATDYKACVKKADTSLTDWERLVGALRSAILDMTSALPTPETAQPSAPPAVLPLSQPALPELPALDAAVAECVMSATADDTFWALLPVMDALCRRSYGLVAYGDRTTYTDVSGFAPGQAYHAELIDKCQAMADSVSKQSPAGLAHKCNIPSILNDMLAVGSSISPLPYQSTDNHLSPFALKAHHRR